MKEVTLEADQGSATENGRRVGVKTGGVKEEDYNDYQVMEGKPSNFEVVGWCLYEFCSYFIQTVLIPIVFPLIISQLQQLTSEPVQDWFTHHPGFHCSLKEIRLYSKLTEETIRVSGSKFSSFEWTSIGWAGGLLLAAPILGFVSYHLDGYFQTLITVAATGVGAFFCLPAGFFKVTKIFIPYIAIIVAASTVASAAHTHHLGLMVRAFTGPIITKPQFPIRQSISHRISLYAAAAGSVGSAIISAFTYHMLREPNEHEFVSLWVVSIFSGLKWLVGLIHAYTSMAFSCASSSSLSPVSPISKFHPFTIFKYPHAIGGLLGVFLSSFTTMCVFTGGVIFVVGNLCIKPIQLLFLWLTYFLFPLLSLPLLQPLQHLIRTNAVRMQVLGFLLSLFSCGFGFYFHNSIWKWGLLLVFGAIQGTSAGVLHASGRVLVMDCAPCGKEGAFAIWFAWMRAAGLCAGFTMGSVVPGRVRASFGVAFCGALAGIVGLVFSNISDVGGAVAAGHVLVDDGQSQRSSIVVSGLDFKSKEREASRV